ncbi:hypothetical protein QC761_407241 [Podospora bellae-mahoneyi]|uniref:Uncharacterized protein n=1 Tax=Podospora bellae-mahoneyi TaxID=2093777 RepID=A0ABR0FHX6_9PEZI|nr:hypothetical protein QC761_407241 [Podospora bellae-mahoneyi]
MSRGLDPDIHAIFPTSCWKECDTAHELVQETETLLNGATQPLNLSSITNNVMFVFWAKTEYTVTSEPAHIVQPMYSTRPHSLFNYRPRQLLSTTTYPATTSTTATPSDWKATSEDNPPTHAVDNEQIDNHQGRDNQNLGSGHLSSLQLLGIISGAGTIFVLLLAALACWKLAGYRRRASQLSKKEEALNEIESQGTQKMNGISINELDDPPAPRIEMDIEPGVCEMEVMFPLAELRERSGYEELEVISGQDRRQENPKPARGKRPAPDKSGSKFVLR